MNDFEIFMKSSISKNSFTNKLFKFMNKIKFNQKNIVFIEIKNVKMNYDDKLNIF